MKKKLKKFIVGNNRDNILFNENENKSDIQNLCVKGENLLSFNWIKILKKMPKCKF